MQLIHQLPPQETGNRYGKDEQWLLPGDILRITSTGQFKPGSLIDNVFTPDGEVNGAPAPTGSENGLGANRWQVHGGTKYGVFARYNPSGLTFLAGIDSGCVQIPWNELGPDRTALRPGYLELILNDEDADNNTSDIAVRVHVWRKQ